jgi:hypothetical protein
MLLSEDPVDHDHKATAEGRLVGLDQLLAVVSLGVFGVEQRAVL